MQLEFKWSSWLRRFKPQPARKRAPTRQDGGLTAWCAEQAERLEMPALARKVRVSWNPRLRTTAGWACWPDCTIELNPRLRDLDADELWRTLKHELAHLVAFAREGRGRRIAPHGPEWRQACAELGIPGEPAYHDLPFKARRQRRRHAYVCPNCLGVIERVRPIRRAVACYECCRKFNRGAYHDRFRMIKKRTAA